VNFADAGPKWLVAAYANLTALWSVPLASERPLSVSTESGERPLRPWRWGSSLRCRPFGLLQ